jgi:hypothetical protein
MSGDSFFLFWLLLPLYTTLDPFNTHLSYCHSVPYADHTEASSAYELLSVVIFIQPMINLVVLLFRYLFYLPRCF